MVSFRALLVPALAASSLSACHGGSAASDPELPGGVTPGATSASAAPAAGTAAPAAGTNVGNPPAVTCAGPGPRVSPLFAGLEEALPTRFVRDDGVLVTRGAGRVRQRHELEGTFGPFGPHYFEHRSYGFVIEDYTGLGQSLVRVSYLPIAHPEDKTNFRAFKVYDNGNVFHANTGMDSDTPVPSLRRAGRELDYAKDVAPYARVQSHAVDRNAREGRALQKGDLLEFEFGVFITPSAVRPDSRTSYYTDTFRYRVGNGGLTPDNADTSGRSGPSERARLGGDTTIAWLYAEPETSFSQLALNVQHEHVQRFVEGRRLFHTDFATGVHSEPGNPAFPEQAGKAGPHAQTSRCEGCHVLNGGGQTLSGALDAKSPMVFKLYDSPLGAQLAPDLGTAMRAGSEAKDATLGDGSTIALSRPTFTVSASGVTRYSPRIARRLVGLGLLEAIPEDTLLSAADPEDCDGDGISGRAHLVLDPSDGKTRVGRFGWRAEKVSVQHQVGDALARDMGVSSPLFPGDAGAPELAADDLTRLTTYMRLLGVPGQRDVDDDSVVRGEALFHSTGCANCHAPAVVTGDTHPFVELRAQSIRPYTDLLLHDLGPDLCDVGGESRDGHGSEPAAPSEWRTAPLWGIGLSARVQGSTALLHDGRAQSVPEAVLWHGGEASRARAVFSTLSSIERADLVRFVESL